jgi:isoquinoline 1-oxidoreductase subunit beta
MPDAPQLETYLVEGGRPPGGIGEPPLALIAPSVANAIFHATGTRLRKLPLQLSEASPVSIAPAQEKPEA